MLSDFSQLLPSHGMPSDDISRVEFSRADSFGTNSGQNFPWEIKKFLINSHAFQTFLQSFAGRTHGLASEVIRQADERENWRSTDIRFGGLAYEQADGQTTRMSLR